jgi:predicted nucleic acid-binding protein
VAVLNKADADHRSCPDLLEEDVGPVVVPSPVLTEVCYFQETRVRPEAEAKFLQALADGEFELAELTRTDLAEMAELVRRYADFPLGAVDASVMAVTERLMCKEIATLDPRHFTAVKPSHVSAFTLLPA